ncbi:S8 family serine peptidase [Micromonospora sp. CPCC 205371]|nr:S8 family serine peptidase [Micromonospora sp. CPCC 205371]
MSRPAWLRAAVACAVLVLGLPVVAARASAAPPPDVAPSYGVSEPIGEVTLVTGDVVTVGVEPNGGLSAEVTAPAPRRNGRAVVYSTVRERDSLYVYPSDALGPVTEGRLDRRLFDVAYLARNGYADKDSKTLPVIVRYPAGARSDLSRRADDLPASARTATLATVNAAAVEVEKPNAETFWASALAGIDSLWLDGRVQADLAESVPMIGAPQAWASGYDGSGVTVAVLDTGVDEKHPALAGKVTATRSFVPGQGVQDGNGHGTHVASTVAGVDGRYKGVAPGASLIVGKVLDNSGNGSESRIIAGMQWAVDQGADVVNMSLGGCCTDGTDPMSQAVDRLSTQSGALFVIAAGNNGANGNRTINSPGAATSALTVAAVDKQDRTASFSSRGPRVGDFGLKPDISAPGVAITAARADGTALGPVVDEKFTTISGTSMASPHVAGAAAILAQRHPDWTGTRLKDALMSAAKDTGADPHEQGAGRVDVARSIGQGVYATGSVDFGRIAYDQANPVTRSVTYTNDTDEPVTLSLEPSISARTGPAPAGALRLDRTTVTVPAQGSAPVVAAFDPTGGPDTWYQGKIRARANGVEVTTAVGAFREMKKVDITLRVIPPDGASQLFYGGWTLLRIDGRDEVPLHGETAEVPEVSGQIYAGRYAVRTFVEWRDASGAPNAALVAAPDVDASNDTTVVLDLRKAKRIGADTPRPTERYVHQFGFESTVAGGVARARVEVRMYGAMTLWTLPTAKPTVGSFYAYSQQIHVAPRLAMRIAGRHATLDARYQSPNAAVSDDEIPRFDGRLRLPVVYAGRGTAEDIAGLDLRGKLALLDLSDICGVTCTDYGTTRVRAVAAAGAAGVAGFGSAGRGFLDPDPYAARPTWPVYPVPTVSLAAEQGRALRDSLTSGSVSVDITGSVDPDYVYALTYPWEDRIPKSLSGRVHGNELYQVDNRIHADVPGTATLTWNAQLPELSYPKRVGNGNGLPVRAPSEITTYYGPVSQNVGWFHGAQVSYDAAPGIARPGGWADSRIEEFTRPGHRVQEWGEHPLVPNTTQYTSSTAEYFTRTCLSCRNGDMFNPVHVLDNDGQGSGYQAYDISNGYYGDEQTELRLYRDGVEVSRQQGLVWIAPPWFAYVNAYFMLPPERANYRLTERHPTLAGAQRWTRTVETEWTFTSERPKSGYTSTADGANCMGWYMTWPNPPDVCKPTSQLFVGYDLGLRLDNTLQAGKSHRITVSAAHSPFLRPAPKVSKLELWTSVDDGAHWTRVRTAPVGGGRYTATVQHPALTGTTGAVSLRVRAVDAAGNTVTQTIHRAYGLT